MHVYKTSHHINNEILNVSSLCWRGEQSGLSLVVLVLSCVWLCDSMNCSPQFSSVHGIFPARIVECIAISSYRGSSWPVIKMEPPASLALSGRFFTTGATILGSPCILVFTQSLNGIPGYWIRQERNKMYSD